MPRAINIFPIARQRSPPRSRESSVRRIERRPGRPKTPLTGRPCTDTVLALIDSSQSYSYSRISVDTSLPLDEGITLAAAMSKSPVFISTHPVVLSKISELRAKQNDAKTTRTLISEISSLLGYEATRDSLATTTTATSQGETPTGASYDVLTLTPTRICLVPVLRSGLGMTDSFLRLLPAATEVHHLGLFREEDTLSAVEYYNKLPHPSTEQGHVETAFIVDPILATGNTACAAIQIMREWGVRRIVFTCVLASKAGLERVSREWPEGVTLVVGCVDDKLNERGFIVPGVGDVGDRLYETRY